MCLRWYWLATEVDFVLVTHACCPIMQTLPLASRRGYMRVLKDVGYRIREEALRPTRPLVSDYPYASRLAALYGCSQEGFLVLRELGVANLSIWGISFVDLGCMVLAIDHRVGVFKQNLQGCAGTIRGYFSSLLRPQNYSVSFGLRHWLSALLERILLGTCLLLVGADSDLRGSER